MNDLLKLIQTRHSARAPFDKKRPISKDNLRHILEAGSWAPTAHNMQNFDIVVVDDEKTLKQIGEIKTKTSEAFIRENFRQLSFSEEELQRKKVGILGTQFPPSWRDAARLEEAIHNTAPSTLSQTIKGSPTVIIVTYDTQKRAPASEGDVLGFLSLGCVMENMWLVSEQLGIGFQIMSVFSGDTVQKEIKKILQIPDYMNIAYAARLGYPISETPYLRVRRKVDDFTRHNLFRKKGLG